MDAHSGIISFVVIVLLYLLPYILATVNKHHNAAAILILNLLLGWTILGWIAALIWALTRPAPRLGPPTS